MRIILLRKTILNSEIMYKYTIILENKYWFFEMIKTTETQIESFLNQII
jgi:hypothetical protein